MPFNCGFGCPFGTQLSLYRAAFSPTNWFIELSRSQGGEKHFLYPRWDWISILHLPCSTMSLSPRGKPPSLWHKMWSHPESQKITCTHAVEAEQSLHFKSFFKRLCLVGKKTILFHNKKPHLVGSLLLTKTTSALWVLVIRINLLFPL